MPTRETGASGQCSAVMKAIKKEYPSAWVLKTVGNSRQGVGVPDILACIEGQFFALEVKHKRPGESEEHARSRTSEQQEQELWTIAAAGGWAKVVLNPQEALSFISFSLLS